MVKETKLAQLIYDQAEAALDTFTAAWLRRDGNNVFKVSDEFNRKLAEAANQMREKVRNLDNVSLDLAEASVGEGFQNLLANYSRDPGRAQADAALMATTRELGRALAESWGQRAPEQWRAAWNKVLDSAPDRDLIEAAYSTSAPFPQVISDILAREFPRTLAPEFIRIVPVSVTAPFIRFLRVQYTNTTGPVQAGDYTWPTWGLRPGESLNFSPEYGGNVVRGEPHSLAGVASGSPVTFLTRDEFYEEVYIHKIDVTSIDFGGAWQLVTGSVRSQLLVPLTTGSPRTLVVELAVTDGVQEVEVKLTFEAVLTGNAREVKLTLITVEAGSLTFSSVDLVVYMDYNRPTDQPFHGVKVSIDADTLPLTKRALTAAIDVEEWLTINTHGVEALELIRKVVRDVILLSIDRTFLHNLMRDLAAAGRVSSVTIDLRRGAGTFLPVQEYAREVYAFIMKAAAKMHAENGRVAPNKLLVDPELFSTIVAPNVITKSGGINGTGQIGVANFAGETVDNLQVFVDPLAPHRNLAMLAYMGQDMWDVGAIATTIAPAILVPHTLAWADTNQARMMLLVWEVFGFRVYDYLYYSMVAFDIRGSLGNFVDVRTW